MSSEEDIKAFQDLYLRKFSMELTHEEALKVAKQVIGIVYVQRYFPVEPLSESEIRELGSETVEPKPERGSIDSISRKSHKRD